MYWRVINESSSNNLIEFVKDFFENGLMSKKMLDLFCWFFKEGFFIVLSVDGGMLGDSWVIYKGDIGLKWIFRIFFVLC